MAFEEKHHLDFPFGIGEQGGMRQTGSADHIKDEIITILLTSPGERVNLPEFGCGLRDLVFSANDEVLRTMMNHSIVRALKRWLGDLIIVNSVGVRNFEEKLFIEIAYTIKETLEQDRVALGT